MRKGIDAKVAKEIIGQVKEINIALAQLKHYIDKNFKVQIADIQSYYATAKSLYDYLNQTATFFSAIKHLNNRSEKCTQVCTGHFDEIIHNLQFHDIIKQKLDHMKDINEEVLLELSVNEENEGSLPYTAMIGEIKSVSVAQLALIKKEYSMAFDKMMENLEAIRKEMKKVGDILGDDVVASSIPDKQGPQFKGHLDQWKELLSAIGQKITEIEAETAFASKSETLQALLTAFPVQQCFGLKESVDQEEQFKVIRSIHNRFTMESERKLLRKVMQKAGYQSALDYENAKGQQHGNIDLF